ncbi:AAA family ATPase [Variovorax sp. ZT4R33]|uniref:AAA family ATPase n=1 Tax=Variovorax sp. ZT4R33 TaxID=3443743 RepID=UPI003F446B67
MKKCEKSKAFAPAFLKSSRVQEARTRLRQHYALPDELREVKRAPVDIELLNNPEVNSSLRELFHDSCAFCENPASRFRSADVIDHFRPLSSADDGKGATSNDHYGWFAYDWENLLLVCPACQSSKRNLFPTQRARAPVLGTWEEAGRSEGPMLLDPCVDEPLRHLCIWREGVFVARTERGDATIEIVELNRKTLVEERAELVGRIIGSFRLFIGGGNGEDLRRFARGAGERRPGACLLVLRTICDLLPAGATLAGRGRGSAKAFRQHFESLLATLDLSTWQSALTRYMTLDAGALKRILRRPTFDVVHPLLSQRSAAARVRRIAIHDFKGIELLELEVPTGSRHSTGSMMLLGENSTGKSSVLQAIYLALATPAQRRGLRLDVEDFVSRERHGWKMVNEKPARVVLELDSGQLVKLEIDVNSGVERNSGDLGVLVLAYGAHRVFRRGRLSGSAQASRTLFDSLAPIPDPTQWLREANDDEFKAVARALNEVLALKADDHISRDDEGNVQVKAHGRTTPIERMSDGYRSLFSMAVDVMRRMVERWGNLEEARGVVLIDEVETHLHPRWKMLVMSALRRSMPQVQFIVTTHDPLCLRGMVDGEVQVLVRNEYDGIESLTNLPNVQGMRAEQLLTSEYFGLASTTDPEIELLLEEYVRAATTSVDGEAASKKLLDTLAQRISQTTLLGDDPAQQILAEATARYLSIRASSPLKTAAAREDAVRAVLDVLDGSIA